MTTADRYRKAKRIFLEALAEPVENRRAFLGRRCVKNPELRAEVEDLLRHHEGSDEFGSPEDEGPRFPPGTLLGKRYRVVELIGKGGMGEVYRAEDLELRQTVALKFLPADIADDPVAMDRLRDEVRLALRVTHANVCRIYDLAEVNGEPLIAMEYVPGEDLSGLLRRIGRLPVDKAIEVARQLSAGLAAAHGVGVLHRDLKPANVLVDREGSVRITDFGIAVPAGASGLPWARAGTPTYMAPEQLAGRKVDERSDLFSLGLVFYEMVTGRPAFEGGRTSRVRAEDDDRVPAPSELVAQVDPSFEKVILKCLREDPDERPQSALEVLAELPGGDSLEAVLALGRTPSPEEVADAGGGRTLKPSQTIVGLATLVLLSSFLLLFGEKAFQWREVGLEKPPEILVERARQVLAVAGHLEAGESAVDSAWGYLQPSEEEIFGKLRFWYRESPESLAPEDAYNLFYLDGAVERWDPAPLEPGMSSVDLDSEGRLSYLKIIPPIAWPEEGSAEPVDWSPLAELAGLDPENLEPIEPRQVPRVFGDTLEAFEGELDGEPRVVHAAAIAGKAVYFDVSLPEDVGSDVWQAPGLWEIASTFDQFLWFAWLVFAIVLARRHLLDGRGDRQGATRLAFFVLAFRMAAWVLQGQHVSDLSLELDLLGFALAPSLEEAIEAWLIYIAIEPLVRKYWPRSLISWNRLLRGRFADPLVGRDLLVGSIVGTFWAVAGALDLWLPRALGRVHGPPPVDDWVLTGLHSGRDLLGNLLDGAVSAVYQSVFMLLVFALLRRWIGRDSWAVAAWLALTLPVWVLMATDPWISWITIGLGVVVLAAWLLLRFGLVALAAATFAHFTLTSYPLTHRVDAWYWEAALVGVTAVLAVAALGAYGANRPESSQSA